MRFKHATSLGDGWYYRIEGGIKKSFQNKGQDGRLYYLEMQKYNQDGGVIEEEYTPEELAKKEQDDQRAEQERLNAESLSFLNETDWKVTRHRDQLDSGSETSMTEQEYNDLLAERQAKRDSIITI